MLQGGNYIKFYSCCHPPSHRLLAIEKKYNYEESIEERRKQRVTIEEAKRVEREKLVAKAKDVEREKIKEKEIFVEKQEKLMR